MLKIKTSAKVVSIICNRHEPGTIVMTSDESVILNHHGGKTMNMQTAKTISVNMSRVSILYDKKGP